MAEYTLMPETHLDITEHGEVKWFKGYGAVPVAPFEGECEHFGREVIAWGWDAKHYEFVQCSDCLSRSWNTDRGVVTTPWMQPKT
ncbi:hypothetical protein [Arthrobacter sp. YN]|uniref:hypothetical protein n=1 Tax=Arthrobacter sp. YN TaxID=2020486 RepID=UPI000B60C3DD|nr:hypothetical protein [Arthrobacter sp. YN]ASN20692.1 hypothetical protein CGK93_14145 [Arthrobacter sp. YN]